nr:hoxL [Cupriavidus necator H16]
MCIGIPMQVMAIEPGYAVCAGRGERRRVSSALVGDCQQGDWLLVFLDSARERIDALRAHEIDATLDMLQAACWVLTHPKRNHVLNCHRRWPEDLAVLSNSRDSSSY